jgi:hypothetical protein
MKLRLMALLLLVALMFMLVSSVAAQSYSFNVNQETVNVFWNSDGTIALDYVFNFSNDAGAHVIDFVDVGMPNGSFDSNSISADINGHSLGISSDFQGEGSFGFAVDMGTYAIQPGQSGSVHVSVGSITNMVYPDDSEPDTYASGSFSPAYWTTAHGSTNMTVIFHLPPGVQPQEPRYHPATGGWPCDVNPQADHDNQNRITYTWTCPNASGSQQYTFGLSFPKQYIPAGTIVTTTSAPYFNLSGFLSNFSVWGFLCCFGILFIGAPVLGAINERKRKLQYLPPKISIEGHGIKRGLTAVEAAILMEQPLDKVMTMILFSVVKKNVATVVTRDPLKLDIASPLPDDLHDYEKDFLTAFSKPVLGDRRKELQEMTIKLVKSVGDKMKGFSRKETADYYKAIMERAWQQIEAAGTPEVKSQMYEDALEWTMLDKNYDERTQRTFTGPIFVPIWWGRFDPGYRPVSTGSVGGAKPSLSIPTSSSGGRVSIPGSAFAASVVTGVQGFSSHVLGDIRSFTSGVTNRTNPVPVSSSRSKGGWSGGGGHSCACACACAGCACACAGGGR